MTDFRIELLGGRVLRQPEDISAADPGQATRPRDEQEAQGPHAPQQVGIRALPGAPLGDREGIELEGASSRGRDPHIYDALQGGPSRGTSGRAYSVMLTAC
jgi:hypothetical protein